MAVSMQGDGGVGLEFLSVQCAQHANVVGGPGSGTDDSIISVYHFVELTNH